MTGKQKQVISTIVGLLATGSLIWVNCQPEKPLGALDEMPLSVIEKCEELVEWAPGTRPLPSLVAEARAGAIKSWNTNEVLRASDLNSNFSHIHGAMVGGHGARLVDADVSTTAAVSHSKMATPALLPKAWAALIVLCDGAAAAGTACAVSDSSQTTGVSSNGTAGQYRVNLTYSPPDAKFLVLATAHTADIYCVVMTFTGGTGDANGTNFLVVCQDATGADANTAFSFLVLDT